MEGIHNFYFLCNGRLAKIAATKPSNIGVERELQQGMVLAESLGHERWSGSAFSESLHRWFKGCVWGPRVCRGWKGAEGRTGIGFK